MRECVRGRGVGEVVGGHVDRLDRRDRALARRGDALLQLPHLGGERGLVADGARHAPEQGGHLRACLHEAEDVVDEEEDVLALLAEVLRHGQAREADAKAGSRRLVHLPEDERGLLDHARLLHLEPEVVALARAFAHPGEDREALVLLGDVADELLDEDGLADAGTAEEADLAALHVRSKQVDDLDPGLEDLRRGLQLFEAGRIAVNRPALVDLDLVPLVDDIAENVEDPAEGRIADRNADRRARVLDVHPAGEPVGGVHGDRTDAIVAEVLLDLGDQVEGGSPLLLRHRDAERVVDGREAPVKDGVDDDALDLDDLARVVVSHESPGRLPGSVYPSASGRDPLID